MDWYRAAAAAAIAAAAVAVAVAVLRLLGSLLLLLFHDDCKLHDRTRHELLFVS